MFKMNAKQIVYDKYTMYKHIKASPLNLTHTHTKLWTIHGNRKHHIAFNRDK